MPVTEFAVRTGVVSGLGSLARLDEALASTGARRPAVAVDAALASNGLLEQVLAHTSIPPVSVSEFPSNPDVASVEAAARAAREAGADAVLAIGGGSALGGGKAVAIRLTNDEPITAFEGVNRVPRPPAPTIAVATTAGSGSEVSNALVLHEPGRSTELVVRGAGCEPRVAILDAQLLRGLPATPMMHAGIDALSHCLESLWATKGDFFTTALAIRAAWRIVELLPVAVEGAAVGGASSANRAGENDAVLQELLEASSAANMACGNSGLGLVHALSSSPAVPLAHGQQNGILLPYIGAFNAGVLSDEGRSILDALPALYERLGFVPDFGAHTGAAIRVDDILASAAGHPFRANNKRSSTDEELTELLVAAGAKCEVPVE